MCISASAPHSPFLQPWSPTATTAKKKPTKTEASPKLAQLLKQLSVFQLFGLAVHYRTSSQETCHPKMLNKAPVFMQLLLSCKIHPGLEQELNPINNKQQQLKTSLALFNSRSLCQSRKCLPKRVPVQQPRSFLRSGGDATLKKASFPHPVILGEPPCKTVSKMGDCFQLQFGKRTAQS